MVCLDFQFLFLCIHCSITAKLKTKTISLFVAVMPDSEMEDLLANIFGKRSHPMYKYWRMMYWMPKIKFLSPWLLPSPVPDGAFELAKLAVRQMCTVDVESFVDIFDTDSVEESLDKTWIVSGQSPEQKKLLNKHSAESPLKIEGPFAIWLRNRSINYFTLIGDAEPDENFEPEEDLDSMYHLANIFFYIFDINDLIRIFQMFKIFECQAF